ncbi:MAG: peptidoglycan editing factor PgeF, partial [Vicinamibacterales bacterium]
MQAPWGPVLRCRALRPFADHFFTTASLTLRDDLEEWTAVAAFADVPVDRLRLLTQVHGRTIASSPSGAPWMRPEADGVITDDPSVALVVRVADCAPILLADRRLGVAAAVHAGWRSTIQRIVPAAIDALHGSYGTDPSDLVVAVGPSLGVCCGEMGEEVVEAFRAAGHDAATLDRWFVRTPGKRPHFDLWRANGEQLEASGVPPSAIHVAGLCTRTYAGTFHSYRAAGPAAGRMAAVIRKTGPGSRPTRRSGLPGR